MVKTAIDLGGQTQVQKRWQRRKHTQWQNWTQKRSNSNSFARLSTFSASSRRVAAASRSRRRLVELPERPGELEHLPDLRLELAEREDPAEP